MQIVEMMESELLRVVSKGNYEAVKELTSNNEILKRVTHQGNSALHVAAARGHQDIVELLVRRMPSMLSMLNSNKETALHTAARSGKSNVVRVLLNVGNVLQANRNSPSSPIGEQLFWRAETKEGETTLHYAVKGNCMDAVEQLLCNVKGIELTANKMGESPLYTACFYGRLDIVKRLLSVSPALAVKRNDGTSCLHLAIINILEWSYVGDDCTSKADNLLQWHELATQLVRERPHLAEAVDPSGNSPLHLLAAFPFPSEYHLELVKKLLNAGPNMNFQFNNGHMAPIHIAARDGNLEVIKCLIDSAPHCSYLLGKKKKNALHFTLEDGHGDSVLHKVKYLLEESADKSFLLGKPDRKGKTALSIASEELVEPLKSSILQTMLGTSSSHPNIFKKSKTSNEVASHEANGNQANEDVKVKDPIEGLSVVAALIATITFAAAFTIPGGLNQDNGTPILMHSTALHFFILYNTLAFCLSIFALLQMIFISSKVQHKYFFLHFGKWSKKFAVGKWQKLLAGGSLALSLEATMLTFRSGLYAMVAPANQSLASLVSTIILIFLAVGLVFFYDSLRIILRTARS